MPWKSRLGDFQGLVTCLSNLALCHLERAQRGDREIAAELLREAHAAAETACLPAVESIRQLQAKHSLLT